jgi:hypothetical protein
MTFKASFPTRRGLTRGPVNQCCGRSSSARQEPDAHSRRHAADRHPVSKYDFVCSPGGLRRRPQDRSRRWEKGTGNGFQDCLCRLPSTAGLTSAFVAGHVRERQSFKVKLILTRGRHSKVVVWTLALKLSGFSLLFGVRPEEFRILH